MLPLPTYYYTRADLIEFTTRSPLTTAQITEDTASIGIEKYILYSDAALTTPVGQVLYNATVYNLNTPTKTVTYNPYVVTLFFNDGKNVSASGAHNDTSIFFPTGITQKATVTNSNGFGCCCSLQYVKILALDQEKRQVTLIQHL
uniref:Uncharacterized protein n=1 Tax=viral metagenome TaxID=1070528 RepID=A0A6C0K2J4_9ZZZZ